MSHLFCHRRERNRAVLPATGGSRPHVTPLTTRLHLEPLEDRTLPTALFFTANDGIHGTELWKSDGTENGTALVKDINQGAGSSTPRSLLNWNGILYFTADDGIHGRELWRSDGTANGTTLVQDIYAGVASSAPDHLTALGDYLFFTADNGINGVEL